MVLEKGDFVKINYTGKIKESDQVFDTTIEKVAREAGVYNEEVAFKSQPIVIGGGHVIPGLDEALIGMEVGENKKLDIPAEKGYGPRDPTNIRTFPAKEFKKQGMAPHVGMRVELEGKMGRVLSTSGGRVRVDFNYELAGKSLHYEVTVEEKTNKTEEKIRNLLERHFSFANPNDHEVELEDGRVVITLAEAAKIRNEALLGKHYVANAVFKFIKDVKEVNFMEVFKKPEVKAPPESEKKSVKKTPEKKKTKSKTAKAAK